MSAERFPPLDSPVIDYFPEYADLRTLKNARITFRHLLTMSHGWKSRVNQERQLLKAKDPYRYVLEQPMALPPGAAFNYISPIAHLLATT